MAQLGKFTYMTPKQRKAISVANHHKHVALVSSSTKGGTTLNLLQRILNNLLAFTGADMMEPLLVGQMSEIILISNTIPHVSKRNVMKLAQCLDDDKCSPSQWIKMRRRNTKIRGNLDYLS